MTIINELAPAKINLTLDVLGKRADGYHEIVSLVAFARGAADDVILDTSKPIGSTVGGPFKNTISGQNLIDVALARLAAAAPDLQLGAIHLEKKLPIAAGIGGGSADAAAVLRAVRRANGEAHVDWLGIAQSLGADVPVCFVNSAAWMTGIGDKVQPHTAMPPVRAVLVNPLVPMPADKTAQVFRALQAPAVRTGGVQPTFEPFASETALISFIAARGNVLEGAACFVAPVILEVKRALLATDGCQYAAVSGGGPTCFGIFKNADAAASALQRNHPDWWVRAVMLA